MNENVERVLAELDGFRMDDEITYAAYSRLHDLISELDDLLTQEPRVMQVTEAMDAGVAWLEKYGENEIKPVIILVYEYGYWECLIYNENDAEITLTIDGFNTDWRYWTSRPTDKQREATPWE